MPRTNGVDFPCGPYQNLSSLSVLVLRNNRFHGGIICQGFKGTWPNLQIIDIASNNFDGFIYPNCIASWKGMAIENGVRKQHDPLGFKLFDYNNFYYQNKVTVTTKGQELELVKILKVFTSIDFSSNNFVGAPETIGDLRSLYVLNLSHNALNPKINWNVETARILGPLIKPVNRGDTKRARESYVPLSLYGMIPIGTQLQSFPPTSYEGNTGLCGFPLDKSCKSKKFASNSVIGSNVQLNWQLLITGSGFVVGVALIVAPLLFCKRWRQHYEKQVGRCLKLIIPGYGSS